MVRAFQAGITKGAGASHKRFVLTGLVVCVLAAMDKLDERRWARTGNVLLPAGRACRPVLVALVASIG